MKIWQNVIIGSGPGGSLTAATLDELGEECLVLEEGPRIAPDEKRAYTIEDMRTKYRNGGITAAFGQPKVTYVEGSLLGGGSEVNAGLYHRAPESVLNEWVRDFDCRGLESSNLEPLYAFCESALNISLDSNPPPASWKLARGAEALGWKSVQVPRWIKHSVRQSMSTAILPRLSDRVQISHDTVARRLMRDGSSWLVQTSAGEMKANRVWVCAGAVATPSLLLRSGIRHNIGRSLQMHPSFKFIAEFDDTVNSPSMGIPSHQVKEFAPQMSFGCSISSLPYLAVGLADHLGEIPTLRQRWEKMAIFYSMIRPITRGRIINTPFQREPFLRYRIVDEDLQALAQSIPRLAEMLFASGAKRLYPSLASGLVVNDLKDAEKITAHTLRHQGRLMTVHLFSSCPMGENRKRSATDSFGKVWDQKNLFVNDASLLCGAPGVNPQGTVMAIARRNVLHYAGKYPCP